MNGIELDFSIIALEDDEKELFVNGNISFIDSEVQLEAVSLRLEERVPTEENFKANPSIWQICKLALITFQHHKNLLC